jgi:hypothetical protein
MERELLIFVPGLTARAPDKYTSRLIRNLENYAQRRGAEWGRDQPDAGAAVAYSYQPPSADARPWQIVFREVVWADIPTRLSEQPAHIKFGQGFSLLGWLGALSSGRRGGSWPTNTTWPACSARSSYSCSGT